MSKILRSASAAALLLVVALCIPPSSAARTSATSRPAVTGPVATFTSGGGASFMRVQVDNRGHLYFESPRGWGIGHEGYAMCTGTSGEATAIDLDSSYGHSIRGFTAPVISQPKPGTFPVTITRRTTDGHFKLTALWAMPDAVEKDVTVTMTVKNIGTTTVLDPELFREIEVGATGGYGGDWVVSTVDSVIHWSGEPAHGVVMTARTLAVPHEGGVASDADIPDVCGGYYDPTPFSPVIGGYTRVNYFLPSLAPGASVKVVVVYQRI